MADDSDATGPLAQRVLAYAETVATVVPTIQSPADWAPVAEFLDVDQFERVGTFLEVQNWAQYSEMLTGWASGIDSFETEIHRISEISNLVYFEIEERHHVGDQTVVLNSLTVFEFDDAGKIRHLDVFMQKAP